MKYVLVTGANGGMGKAVTEILKNNGYFVFALDKKTAEQQENVMPITCDITDENSVKQAFEMVKSVTDNLYAILHFAGIYTLNSLVEVSEDEFVKAFNINLFGAYRINKTFLPLLESGSKIVITTSELAPLDPLPFTGLYAITKSALDKYAYSLRMEVQLLGISVTILRPGAVKTDMLPASTKALNDFCENTQLYSCNAKRFKKIVDSVESRNVAPEKIAQKTLKIVKAKKPKHVYKINRNPLLLLLNVLPTRFQTWIIKKILK
jgi:NAD(P)-dependent dehydrogenase (short-subunit alcohol dehydrogenase family)